MFLTLLALATAAVHTAGMPHPTEPDSVTARSRQACVRILQGGQSVGTGFFLDGRHLATCFHVAADDWTLKVEGGVVKQLAFRWRSELSIQLHDGRVVPVEPLSTPTADDYSPIQHDFAVLRLKAPLSAAPPPLALHGASALPPVGSRVSFTGFPLRAPVMLTHYGHISGYGPANDFLCIQASVNKGNSGGALVSEAGLVLGIISNREGDLSTELRATRDQMRAMGERMGSISLEVDTPTGRRPVNQNELLLNTLDTLEAYISTGIGYARSSRHLSAWLSRHPLTSP